MRPLSGIFTFSWWEPCFCEGDRHLRLAYEEEQEFPGVCGDNIKLQNQFFYGLNTKWLKIDLCKVSITVYRGRKGYPHFFQNVFKQSPVSRPHLSPLTSAQCPCGEADQTPEHYLQSCSLYHQARQQIWPTCVSLKTKLWGSAEDLFLTSKYAALTGLFVGWLLNVPATG